MKKLQDIMPTAIGHAEVLSGARAQKVMRRWEEVVGTLLADKTEPDRFDRGTVWVTASGSAWAQELAMRKEEILSRLNALAGEDRLFKEIRIGTRPRKRE